MACAIFPLYFPVLGQHHTTPLGYSHSNYPRRRLILLTVRVLLVIVQSTTTTAISSCQSQTIYPCFIQTSWCCLGNPITAQALAVVIMWPRTKLLRQRKTHITTTRISVDQLQVKLKTIERRATQMCYAANDYLGYVLLEPAVRQEIRRVLWVVRWIFCTFKVTIHLCCSSLSEGKRSERDLTKFRLSLPFAIRFSRQLSNSL